MTEAYQIQSLFLLSKPGECLLNVFEICHIARKPFDLSFLTGLFLDRINSTLTLVLLPIGHYNTGAVEYEGPSYLIAR